MLSQFQPIFQEYYQTLSKGNEKVSIVYQSQLHDKSFEELLEENLHKDRMAQHSTQGIHKDDLDLNIMNYLIKKFGTQGQQKSYLIALKLAQLELIKQNLNVTPLLLLDDIFDKLDDRRVQQLMEMVSREEFGQLFITDTDAERVRRVFAGIDVELKVFNIQHGTVCDGEAGEATTGNVTDPSN